MGGFGWGLASVRSKLHHGGVAEPHPHPGPPLEGEGEKPRKVRPPRCVIHLETGNPHNILETARRLCIWDNLPLAIIIAKLPRNGFTHPRDNPEILMVIDLTGLSDNRSEEHTSE